jgi:hypothetical protein
MIDHNVFNASWIPKTPIADFAFFVFVPLVSIKYNAIPIMKNNVVHTGPKIQFGGLNRGFLIAKYHVGIELIVKIEPITPAN